MFLVKQCRNGVFETRIVAFQSIGGGSNTENGMVGTPFEYNASVVNPVVVGAVDNGDGYVHTRPLSPPVATFWGRTVMAGYGGSYSNFDLAKSCF